MFFILTRYGGKEIRTLDNPLFRVKNTISRMSAYGGDFNRSTQHFNLIAKRWSDRLMAVQTGRLLCSFSFIISIEGIAMFKHIVFIH